MMKNQAMFCKKTAFGELNLQEQKKKCYQPPIFKVLIVKSDGFFCTSVKPDSQNSTSSEWDTETSHEGGVVYFGTGEGF